MTQFTNQILILRACLGRLRILLFLGSWGTFAMAWGHPGAAHAALSSADLKTAGDSLLTRDSATGLEWLDSLPTLNLSYQAVANGAGGFTTTDGFRFATKAEVLGLFDSANREPNPFPTSDPRFQYSFANNPIGAFWVNSLIGTLGPNPVNNGQPRFYTGVLGYFGTPSSDGIVDTASVTLYQTRGPQADPNQPLPVLADGGIGFFTRQANAPQVEYYSYLVRSSGPMRHVPEPGSLVGLGLVAVVAGKLRSGRRSLV
jgi:hypothetical protein